MTRERNKEHIYSSSRKAKPVKGDHKVFGPTRKVADSTKEGIIDMLTPKKSLMKSNKAYETSSGKKFMRSTQRSNLSEDGDRYMKSEEIEKLKDPKSSMIRLSSDLSSKSWETQVNA